MLDRPKDGTVNSVSSYPNASFVSPSTRFWPFALYQRGFHAWLYEAPDWWRTPCSVQLKAAIVGSKFTDLTMDFVVDSVLIIMYNPS